MDEFRYATLILSVIGVLLHSIGVYCLCCKDTRKSIALHAQITKSQTNFLLLNLCICDIIFSLQNICRTIAKDRFNSDVAVTILDILVYNLGLPFYFGMFALTLQRFLEVFLHMSYRNSWFNRHKENLCVVSWLICIFVSVSAITAYKMNVIDSAHVTRVGGIVSMAFTSVVVIEFFIVYGYIFQKFRMMRCADRSNRYGGRHIVARKKRKRQLYIPFFIVATFIMFISIPDFVIVFSGVYSNYLNLLYYLNVIADALVYLLPNFRANLHRSLTLQCNGKNDDSMVHRRSQTSYVQSSLQPMIASTIV